MKMGRDIGHNMNIIDIGGGYISIIYIKFMYNSIILI